MEVAAAAGDHVAGIDFFPALEYPPGVELRRREGEPGGLGDAPGTLSAPPQDDVDRIFPQHVFRFQVPVHGRGAGDEEDAVGSGAHHIGGKPFFVEARRNRQVGFEEVVNRPRLIGQLHVAAAEAFVMGAREGFARPEAGQTERHAGVFREDGGRNAQG